MSAKKSHVNRKSSSCIYLFLLGDLFLWLGDDLFLLREDHLDEARGAHVGVDATVGPVGTPPHLGSLVHLDVLDDQGVHVQTLPHEPEEQPEISN